MKITEIPKNVGKTMIRVYQKTFSFDHAFWAQPEKIRICLHQPSCSQYTYEAVDRHGLIKGSIMGGARIARCNGISGGGYDPVPNKFQLTANKDID